MVGCDESQGPTIMRKKADIAASGTAHSGMLAKLAACRHALTRGVAEVVIVAGRGIEDFDATVGTRVYAG